MDKEFDSDNPELLDRGDAALLLDDDEPSPVPGMRMGEFRTVVRLAITDPDNPLVGAAFTQWALMRPDSGQAGKSKKERDQEFFDFLIRQAIQQHVRALNMIAQKYDEMAAWYGAQKAKIIENMETLTRSMEKPAEFLREMEDIKNTEILSGKFDREARIRALRKRGVDVKDNVSDEALRELSKKQQEMDHKILAEAQRLYDIEKKTLEDLDKKQKETEDGAKKARDEIREIQNDKSLSPEERERRVSEAVKKAGDEQAHRAATMEQDKVAGDKINSEVQKLSVDASKTVESYEDDDEPKAKKDSKNVAEFNALAKPVSKDQAVVPDGAQIREPQQSQKILISPGG